MIKQAIKQKLLPVGYGKSSVLKKDQKQLNTFGFLNGKLQKGTRIALQYGMVSSMICSHIIWKFSISCYGKTRNLRLFPGKNLKIQGLLP